MSAPDSPDTTASDPSTCTVCPHRRIDHDAIAARYCAATAKSLRSGKGCVCRPGH